MTSRPFLRGLGCVMASCWLMCMTPHATADAGPGMHSSFPTCQILDYDDETIYDVSITVIGDSSVEDLGETGMAELDWNWQFAYFEWFLWGSMDLNLDFGTVFLTDSAVAKGTSQLVRLALDLGWTWRFPNGLGFQLDARPGVYADAENLSGDIFYYPASAALIYSFNDSFSALAGVDVRTDFGRGLWPLVRLEWEMASACRLRLGFPENRLSVFMGRRVEVYVGYDWRSDSYRLGGDSSDDLQIVTLEDVRAYGGIGVDLSDELTLRVEAGTVTDRKIAFNEIGGDVDNDYDMDDGTMVRIAISGPF